MCDTLIASPQSTAERIMLFGKNSDRQRNEAQFVECLPAVDHPRDASLECTYLTIPQVRHTHAVLLSRPFWIWGAEMGANEHGVVIGNEGLLARSPAARKEALTGMDLLRLALERAATAAEASEIIIGLLERYGQGGNCGHLASAYYNNGFLIADPNEAFVLETVEREWVLERARGARAISNIYSIGCGAERRSSGLHAFLREIGCEDTQPNYAEVIADPQMTHIGSAAGRLARATFLLASAHDRLQIADVIRILRDHDPGGHNDAEWAPNTSAKPSLCVHAGSAERSGQTTASLASEIRENGSVHWVTASAAPCISIFKPVLLDTPLPAHGPRPTGHYDPEAFWWQHERLHRTALRADFRRFLSSVCHERDALEADFRRRVSAVLNGGDAAERSAVIASCWTDALETEDRWVAHIGPAVHRDERAYDAEWTRLNRIAGFE